MKTKLKSIGRTLTRNELGKIGGGAINRAGKCKSDAFCTKGCREQVSDTKWKCSNCCIT